LSIIQEKRTLGRKDDAGRFRIIQATLECGAGDRQDDLLLAFGTEKSGHAWLHSDWWSAWHESRLADAIVALSAMGVKAPPEPRNLLSMGALANELMTSRSACDRSRSR